MQILYQLGRKALALGKSTAPRSPSGSSRIARRTRARSGLETAATCFLCFFSRGSSHYCPCPYGNFTLHAFSSFMLINALFRAYKCPLRAEHLFRTLQSPRQKSPCPSHFEVSRIWILADSSSPVADIGPSGPFVKIAPTA